MTTLAKYLIDRLHRAGLKHGFGVPGDYTLPLYNSFRNSPIELIGTTNELCAGYAADAYARVNGIGLAVVTYCVGGFSILNAIAQAEAEKSPVVLISGSPGLKERQEKLLLHHMVRHFECQHSVFANVTCANTVLRDPARAAYEIDRVLEALKTYKRPIYIEIPRDMMDKSVSYSLEQGTPKPHTSDEEILDEVLAEVVDYINSSKHPVILAGEEVARFGLQEKLKRLAEMTNIPVATTFLGKSVFNERHDLSLGVYAGGMSKEGIAKIVEHSDCLIMLGVMQTDVNMGFLPLKIGKRKVILVTSESCQIRNSFYKDIIFQEFVDGLLASNVHPRNAAITLSKSSRDKEYVAKSDTKITVVRFFEKIDTILNEKTAILADVGDSLFGASDLTVHNSMQFLSPAFYTSMGFAVPGTLGVITARPDLQSLVFVGDGAFQMTGLEISTLVKRCRDTNAKAPKIFVLNNDGYTTERLLLEGPWNDIPRWEYEKVVQMVGGGRGFVVETEEDLERVLREVMNCNDVCIVNVKLAKNDISPALQRFVSKLNYKKK